MEKSVEGNGNGNWQYLDNSTEYVSQEQLKKAVDAVKREYVKLFDDVENVIKAGTRLESRLLEVERAVRGLSALGFMFGCLLDKPAKFLAYAEEIVRRRWKLCPLCAGKGSISRLGEDAPKVCVNCRGKGVLCRSENRAAHAIKLGYDPFSVSFISLDRLFSEATVRVFGARALITSILLRSDR